jgi:hypothetical protein
LRSSRLNIDRKLLRAKAEELDLTIRKLTAMRDGLRHAAVCPAPTHLECPTFRRILRVASARAAAAKTKRRARRDRVSAPRHSKAIG